MNKPTAVDLLRPCYVKLNNYGPWWQLHKVGSTPLRASCWPPTNRQPFHQLVRPVKMSPYHSTLCPTFRHFGKARLHSVVLLSVLLVMLMVADMAESARGGGGGRGGGKGGRGGRRGQYGSRMPILIQHRNPASASYYENKDGARIVKSSHFELDYMLGRKITFFCMAQGLPRPHITWFKDGIELYAHKFFQVHEWPMGNDTMKSKMEIDPTTQKDAGYYECQADNQYSIDRRGFRTDYVIYTY